MFSPNNNTPGLDYHPPPPHPPRLHSVVHHPNHPLLSFPPFFCCQSDQYLHRVGRAGRFGTKGLAISFISRPEDEAEMQKVSG